MTMTKTNPAGFTPQLKRLQRTGWQVIEGGTTLHKTFKFDSFSEAFVWMTSVAFTAEKIDHHPTWANAFGIVDVTLTTFATGELTALDMKLARAMDEAAGDA